MPLCELTAISPLDGRYRPRINELAEYVSEFSLIKTRIEVETKYLLALSKEKIIRQLTKKEIHLLSSLSENLTIEKAQEVKDIEKETRHDVKAMERVFRSFLKGTSLEDITEMVHFGLTSEDINNLSYRLLCLRATEEVIVLELEGIIDTLTGKAEQYKAIPMIARTHGQAAVPTTLGKEIIIFATRLSNQVQKLRDQKLTGKFSGAVGNFNALYLAYPNTNWIAFSEKFIASFGFHPMLVTTQINPNDDLSEYFQTIQRINTIIINLDQDIWRYISDNWLVQHVKVGEIGSSTMPQKVNPIDFENSEGNLGMANAMLEFMSQKLTISRLQRDLSDSTVMRNIGSALGYCLIGYSSLTTGLSRISPNEEQIRTDLEKDWIILSEGVQTLLRKSGTADPYSLMVSLSRGKHITHDMWEQWIHTLPIDSSHKKLLAKLSPQTYLGLAVQLTEKAVTELRGNMKRKP